MVEKTPPAVDLLGDPWTPPRDPRGRKRHSPKPQVREFVASLKAGGATDEEIALQLGLCEKTLRKYYFRELDHGHTLARNEVLKVLHAKAMGGNISAIREFLRQTEKGDALRATHRPKREPAAPKLGKKEEQQQAAAQVGGRFAPGAPPVRTH